MKTNYIKYIKNFLQVTACFGFTAFPSYGAELPADGVCGSSNGAALQTHPTADLCTSGEASAITGSGPWNWNCEGKEKTASCTATLISEEVKNKVLTGDNSYVSEAAKIETGKLCTEKNGVWPAYPKEWTWSSEDSISQPAAATSGKPEVDQYIPDSTTHNPESTYYTQPVTNVRYRKVAIWGYLGGGVNGRYCDLSGPIIARLGSRWDGSPLDAIHEAVTPYQFQSTKCGPFPYGGNQIVEDGSLFLVHPAVYEGVANQPHFGETYYANNTYTNYTALVTAQNTWSGQYEATANAEAQSFETVPPEPTLVPMNNVTVRGISENNKRPVILAPGASDDLGQGAIYIGCCSNSPKSVNGLTIENIDLVSENAPNGSVRAGIYINGATDLTLRNMRITGFQSAQANGIFSTDAVAGTFRFDGLELSHDGGIPDNYAHHVYIGHSPWDADFTVVMINSWSHDAFAGHLFKSRAQRNILVGNYFQGTLPQNTSTPFGGTYNVSEDYNVDIPWGGRLIAQNNIFVKNLNDNGTGAGNRIMLAYGMEGVKVDDKRVNSIEYTNNTFVGMHAWWQSDNGYQYALVPMDFSYPPVVADPVKGLVGMTAVNAAGSVAGITIPASSIVVKHNAFVGLCGNSLMPGNTHGLPSPDPVAGYRGTLYVTESFSELNQNFTLANKYISEDTSVVGERSYAHEAQFGKRKLQTIGAED